MGVCAVQRGACDFRSQHSVFSSTRWCLRIMRLNRDFPSKDDGNQRSLLVGCHHHQINCSYTCGASNNTTNRRGWAGGESFSTILNSIIKRKHYIILPPHTPLALSVSTAHLPCISLTLALSRTCLSMDNCQLCYLLPLRDPLICRVYFLNSSHNLTCSSSTW